jgi:hypothetical protein
MVGHSKPSSVAAFHAKLSEFTKRAVCEREFVLFNELSSWLRSLADDPLEPNALWIELILREVHETERKEKLNQPMWVNERLESFKDGENCCLKLFCILLKLDIGHLIEGLFERTEDAELPLGSDKLDNYFAGIASGIDSRLRQEYSRQFYAAQFGFCPVVIGRNTHAFLDGEKIVPITSKGRINTKGNIAELWKIRVPKEYVAPRVVDALPRAEVTEDGVTVGPTNIWAVVDSALIIL